MHGADLSPSQGPAVIFRMRADPEAVASLKRTGCRDFGGGMLHALDWILQRYPLAAGYPLGSAPDRRSPPPGTLDWCYPGKVEDPLLEPGFNVLRDAGQSAADVVKALLDDPRITYAYASPKRMPFEVSAKPLSDPWYSDQWSIHKCGFPAAWSQYESDPTTLPMPVAIIDTGYTPTHPDLPNAVLYETFGWPRFDRRGHGTCVGGILGAKRDNGYGLAGAARCDPWVFKVFEDTFSFDNYYRALTLVAITPLIRVVNLSLGESTESVREKELIERCIAQGKTVVAPIGNSPQDSGPIYPALYPGVIAVGATDRADKRATFSINADRVDIAAPGVQLITTSQGPTGYASVDGTSFATALVTAACVLILRKHPDATPGQVRATLQTLVATGTAGKGRGAGRIDLSKL